MKNYELAEAAYKGYYESLCNLSLIDGDKLPAFKELPDKIKDAWFEAAISVIYVNDYR